MNKMVKSVIVLTVTAGVSLWNVKTQNAVALAPVTRVCKAQSQNNRLSAYSMVASENAAAGNLQNSQIKIKFMKKKQTLWKQEEEKRKQQLKKARLTWSHESMGVSANANEESILARIVEAEAGNQGHKGKLLVANVILNRVKSKDFPPTIKKVVFSPRQFSPVSDGSYYRVHVSPDTRKAVDEALSGVDGSKGAVYFMERAYSDSSNVSWFDRSLTHLFTYRDHEFYK